MGRQLVWVDEYLAALAVEVERELIRERIRRLRAAAAVGDHGADLSHTVASTVVVSESSAPDRDSATTVR
jgi:DNA invertase Pin-like site-specific DNA recombinase